MSTSNSSAKQRQLQQVTNKGEIPPERSEHEQLIMQRIKKQQQAIRQRMLEKSNAMNGRATTVEEKAFLLLLEVNGIEMEVYKRSISDQEQVLQEGQENMKIHQLEVFQIPNYTRMLGLDLFPHLTSFFGCMQRFEKIEGLTMSVGLKKLVLDDNLISSIEGLNQCILLEEQYLKNNKLTSLCGLEKLKKQRILDVSENFLQSVDVVLGECENQQILRISKNQQQHVEDITNLQLPLIELNLAGNTISRLNAVKHTMEAFPLLEKLWFQHPDYGTNPVCTLPGYHAFCLNVIYGHSEKPEQAVFDNTLQTPYTANISKTVKNAILRRCLAVQTNGFNQKQLLHSVLAVTPSLQSLYSVDQTSMLLSLPKHIIMVLEQQLKLAREENTQEYTQNSYLLNELEESVAKYSVGKAYVPKHAVGIPDILQHYSDTTQTLPSSYNTVLQSIGNLLTSTTPLTVYTEKESACKSKEEEQVGFVYHYLLQQKSSVQHVQAVHQQQTTLVNEQYTSQLRAQLEELEKGISSSVEVYNAGKGITFVNSSALYTALCNNTSNNNNTTTTNNNNNTGNNFIHISTVPQEVPTWVSLISHWHSHISHNTYTDDHQLHSIQECKKYYQQEALSKYYAVLKQRQMEHRQDEFFAKIHTYTACKQLSCIPDSVALACRKAQVPIALAMGLNGAAYLSREYTTGQVLTPSSIQSSGIQTDSIDPGLTHFFYKVVVASITDVDPALQYVCKIAQDGKATVVTDSQELALQLTGQTHSARYALDIVQVYTGTTVRIPDAVGVTSTVCTCNSDNVVCRSFNTKQCIAPYSNITPSHNASQNIVCDDGDFLFPEVYLHAYSTTITSQLDAIAITDANDRTPSPSSIARVSSYRQSALSSSLLLRTQPSILFRPLPTGIICPLHRQSKATLAKQPPLSPQEAITQHQECTSLLTQTHMEIVTSNKMKEIPIVSSIVCPTQTSLRKPLCIVDTLVQYPYGYTCGSSVNPAIQYIRDASLVLPYMHICGSLQETNTSIGSTECHIAIGTRAMKLPHSLHAQTIPVIGYFDNLHAPIVTNSNTNTNTNTNTNHRYIVSGEHMYSNMFQQYTCNTSNTIDTNHNLPLNPLTPVKISHHLLLTSTTTPKPTPPHILILFILQSIYLRNKLLPVLHQLTVLDFQHLLQILISHLIEQDTQQQISPYIDTLPQLILFTMVCRYTVGIQPKQFVKNVLQQYLQFQQTNTSTFSIPYAMTHESLSVMVPSISSIILPILHPALSACLTVIEKSYLASMQKQSTTPSLDVLEVLIDSSVCHGIKEETKQYSTDSLLSMILKSSYVYTEPSSMQSVLSMCSEDNNTLLDTNSLTSNNLHTQILMQVLPQNTSCQLDHILTHFVHQHDESTGDSDLLLEQVLFILQNVYTITIDKGTLTQRLLGYIYSIQIDGAMLYDGVKQAILMKQHITNGGITHQLRSTIHLQSLTLSNCNQTSVEFLQCPTLRTLDVSLNCLTTLTSIPSTLQSLDTLILHGNELTNISILATRQFQTLRNINISKNQVTNISSLSMLPNLTLLSASDNNIHNTAQLALLGHCTQLYTLNLENNPICTQITPSILFHYIPSIRFFNNTPLSLPSKLRDMTGHVDEAQILQHLLHLKDAQFYTAPISKGCGCYYSCTESPVIYTTLSPSKSSLMKTCPAALLPLPIQVQDKPIHFNNIQVLNLTEQKIRNLEYITATTFPNQHTLILDRNELTSLVSLRPLPKLTTLRLNHNKLVSANLQNIPGVSADVLGQKHYVPNLTVLELAHNLITGISNQKLHGLSKLAALGQEKNQLTRLDGLTELYAQQHLVQNHNVLKKISYGSLNHQHSLRELQVEHNHLATLVGIGYLPSLVAIFLKGNNQCNMSSIQNLEHINGVPEHENNKPSEIPTFTPTSQNPGFSEVCLEDNPIVKLQNYKHVMITKFPHLQVLDSVIITQQDRLEAKQLAEAEAANDYRPQMMMMNAGGIMMPPSLHAHNLMFTGPSMYTGLKQAVQQGGTPLQIQGQTKKKPDEYYIPNNNRPKQNNQQLGLVGNSFGTQNPHEVQGNALRRQQQTKKR